MKWNVSKAVKNKELCNEPNLRKEFSMFCKNCGSQIPDGVKFCTNCGTAMVQTATEQVSASNAVGTPKIQTQPVSQQTVHNNWPVFLLVSIVLYVLPSMISFYWDVTHNYPDQYYPFFVHSAAYLASFIFAICAFVKLGKMIPPGIRNSSLVLLIIQAVQQVYYFRQAIARFF
jgi:hypothetical protein